jgi:choline-sulfatase
MSQQTNAVIVMSDQHFGRVMGCAGHPVVQTPRMDELAAAGTRYEWAHTPSSICVPARASFATCEHVHEIGYWDNAQAYDGRVRGWGHALQDAGVPVQSIGKLHYTNAEDPTGFDQQLLPMHIAGGVGQVWGLVRDPLPVRPGGELMVSMTGAGLSKYNEYDLSITEAACRWLTERGRSEGPWVLYVGLVAPHFPYVVPDEWFSLYDRDAIARATPHPLDGDEPHPWIAQLLATVPGIDAGNTDEERRRCTAAYYGLCSFLDHNVGRIVDALADAGLWDTTRLIYTSDHGDQVGSRGHWGKSMPYEPSVNIPMIVCGPDVEAGAVSETPVSLLDVGQTALDAVGVPQLDVPSGESLLQLADDPDRLMLSQYHAYGAPSAWFLLRRGRFKYVHYVGFEPELFDLHADPDELTNLAADPAHTGVLAALESDLRGVLDPDEVDERAKASQRELVERFGGREAALSMGTTAETPAPGDDG